MREQPADTMSFRSMFVFRSTKGPNDAMFYKAIYSKYVFFFYCVLSVLSWQSGRHFYNAFLGV